MEKERRKKCVKLTDIWIDGVPYSFEHNHLKNGYELLLHDVSKQCDDDPPPRRRV